MFGLEEVLSTELKNLGARDVTIGVRSVSFFGDKGFMYKANMALRTAIRILKPIKHFKVFDEDDLYKKLQQINWERFMNVDSTFSIGAVVNSKNFTSNSHYISLKAKDAIADYFRHKYHKRPNVDIKHPDVKIHVHIQNDFCSVSLDSSGDSLHKRGYRSATNIAPINEVLAAGLVLLSGYTGDCNFIDPMCGSGTILIEAAMIANNIPANINRNEFGFEKWDDYNEDLFFTIQDSLLKKIRDSHFKIMGFDKAPSAVRKANDNVKNANLSDFIGIHHVNFFNSVKEVFGPTTILNCRRFSSRCRTSFFPDINRFSFSYRTVIVCCSICRTTRCNSSSSIISCTYITMLSAGRCIPSCSIIYSRIACIFTASFYTVSVSITSVNASNVITSSFRNLVCSNSLMCTTVIALVIFVAFSTIILIPGMISVIFIPNRFVMVSV